jgi:Fe-S cluster biogenesis protein NfuA
MFIQTESTPNPNSLKFLLDLDLDNQSFEFSSIEECRNSDLAKLLFQINGIEKVFFGQNFISINKKNYDWDQLKAPILTIISEYLSSGKKIITNGAQKNNTESIEFDQKDKNIVDQICDVLNAKVKPAVAKDGGDVDFKKFKDGVVYLNLQGSCAGCPSSSITLKNGIENLLKHYVRDVVGVEQYNV